MPFLSIGDVPWRSLLPGTRACFVHSERMTLSRWEFEAGRALPEHAHPHEQITVCLEGRFELTMAGEKCVLVPGSVTVIPPNAPHQGRALEDSRMLDVFCPARDDYR